MAGKRSIQNLQPPPPIIDTCYNTRKQTATWSVACSFSVHSFCTNASLAHVYTSVIFERRLMTWIFTKKMSMWPTFVRSWISVSRCFAAAAFLPHNPILWRWQAVTCKVYFYYFFCCFNSQSIFSVFSFPFHMLIVSWTN